MQVGTRTSFLCLLLLCAATSASAQTPTACIGIPHTLAVATRSDHGIRFVDLAAGRVTAALATGAGPHELVQSPDGRHLYVANMGVFPRVVDGALIFERGIDSTVTVVDVAGRSIARQFVLSGYQRPHGIARSRDGATLWVTAEERNEVLELDAASGAIERRWLTPQRAHMIIASPDESKLYGATTSGASLTIIDRGSGDVRSLTVPAAPEGMALRPGTKELWVANRVANVLTIVDTESDAVLASIPTGGRFSLKLDFTPDGNTAWVVNNNTGTLSVIDAGRRTLVAVVPLETAPLGVAVSPDGRWVAVTTPRTGSVSVLDAAQRNVLCTVKIGSDADGVVWLAPARAQSSALDHTRYLAEARRIGNWLVSLPPAADGAWPADALRPGASMSLGEGTAGITLFLAELHRATNDTVYARAMRRGADALLAGLPAEFARTGFPPNTSLYYGAPGMAFALLHVHAFTGDARYRSGALRVVQWLQEQHTRREPPAWSDFNDVLFGDAGTALFLLHAAHTLGEDNPGTAAAAGHALLQRAQRTEHGRYWPLRHGTDTNLPNFSHGAAGIGYLMARLFEATHDSTFLHAAIDAGHYLQSIASLDSAGLRIPYGMHRDDWRTRHDVDWAHGVAGSARFFAQLARTTGDTAWLAYVRGARRSVLTAGTAGNAARDEATALDRRFGLAGLADFHLDADDPTSAAFLADTILAHAARDADHLSWTRPRPAFMSDPGAPGQLTGLLHGAAGYGLLLLRLHAGALDVDWRGRLPDGE